MDLDAVLPDHTIVVEDDRIVAVGPSGDIEIAPGITVIDGSGRYVMPGLYDVHVHLDYDEELLYYLPNGVTTIVNLSGRSYHLELRERLSEGEVDGPRLMSCGPIIRGDDLDAASAVELVREHFDAGYDCFKIYANWPLEAYEAASREASELDFQFVGHAPRNLSYDVVLSHPRHRVAHLEEIVYTNDELQTWLDRYRGGAEPLPEHAPEIELRDAVAGVADRTAQAGVWVVPTQIVLDYYAQRSTAEGLERLARRPYLNYLNPVSTRVWARADQSARRVRMEQQVKLQHALLQAFRKAGVKLALGTDAGVEGDLAVMPGWSVHEELDILVRLGYTPYEALRQATVLAAEYLEKEAEGSLAAGNRADLIVLRANPLEDIAAARDVIATVAGGRWFNGHDLQGRLDRLSEHQAGLERVVSRIDAFVAAGDARAATQELGRMNPVPDQLATFVERAINRHGYDLLAAERFEEAIDVLTANIEAFPESANAYDSVGEAYLLSGDRSTAADFYRQALTVDPEFRNAARMLAELGVD
jgi:tetratricopeptide (TPR) repeat protein